MVKRDYRWMMNYCACTRRNNRSTHVIKWQLYCFNFPDRQLKILGIDKSNSIKLRNKKVTIARDISNLWVPWICINLWSQVSAMFPRSMTELIARVIIRPMTMYDDASANGRILRLSRTAQSQYTWQIAHGCFSILPYSDVIVRQTQLFATCLTCLLFWVKVNVERLKRSTRIRKS